MSATKLMPHSCACPTQDKLHGRGVRVWNDCAKKGGSSNGGWSCTGCGVIVPKKGDS